jgi:hypothetical protein
VQNAVTVALAIASILCLLFALVASFPALTVGRDVLFFAGVYLGVAALLRLP